MPQVQNATDEECFYRPLRIFRSWLQCHDSDWCAIVAAGSRNNVTEGFRRPVGSSFHSHGIRRIEQHTSRVLGHGRGENPTLVDPLAISSSALSRQHAYRHLWRWREERLALQVGAPSVVDQSCSQRGPRWRERDKRPRAADVTFFPTIHTGWVSESDVWQGQTFRTDGARQATTGGFPLPPPRRADTRALSPVPVTLPSSARAPISPERFPSRSRSRWACAFRQRSHPSAAAGSIANSAGRSQTPSRQCRQAAV